MAWVDGVKKGVDCCGSTLENSLLEVLSGAIICYHWILLHLSHALIAFDSPGKHEQARGSGLLVV
jgi:hypothetical protein